MEIEIIGLVDVEVTPIRWNRDGSMFMTEDFRWYPADGPATVEANGLPTEWIPAVKVGGRVDDGYRARRTMAATATMRHCEGCGAGLLPTGKRGRPAKRCNDCKNGTSGK